MMERLDIVMPVYNEAGRVGRVLEAWSVVCRQLADADWTIHVYDDGSRDGTADVLARVAAVSRGRVVVHTQSNRGHGPTVLRGYREAVARGADWIFQTDSDGEMPPAALKDLWEHRRETDFLAGIRTGRQQILGRRIMSAVSRGTVLLGFGRSIHDVNVPYRLMRVGAFSNLFNSVSDTAFAPNVILSGLAAREGLRVWETPVPHTAQVGSTAKWRMVRGAVRALFETVSMGLGRFLLLALAVSGLIWGLSFALSPSGSQAGVFCERGQSFFGDFTRMAQVAQAGIHVEGVSPCDVCYVALAYAVAKLFPADVWGGAVFTGIGWLCFLLSGVALVRSRKMKGICLLTIMAFAACSPLLYAVEWGNPIVYAGAGIVLWMAWKDDPSSTRRMWAACALAVAAVLKVAPAIFALDYLVRRKRDWRSLALFVGAGSALFLAPWCLWGGWEGLLGWFSNAAANARHYVHKGAWGAVPIGRTIRVLLHQDVSQAWLGIGWERVVSVTWGCLALLAGLRTRSAYPRMLGLTAALLLIPGNMHFYTGIYLIPVCILWCLDSSVIGWRVRFFEAFCWLMVFLPLQIPFGAGCLNHPLANLAFLGLVAMAMGGVLGTSAPGNVDCGAAGRV